MIFFVCKRAQKEWRRHHVPFPYWTLLFFSFAFLESRPHLFLPSQEHPLHISVAEIWIVLYGSSIAVSVRYLVVISASLLLTQCSVSVWVYELLFFVFFLFAGLSRREMMYTAARRLCGGSTGSPLLGLRYMYLRSLSTSFREERDTFGPIRVPSDKFVFLHWFSITWLLVRFQWECVAELWWFSFDWFLQVIFAI